MTRLAAWFERQSPEEQVGWTGVAFCAALYLFHYALLSGWYIEDSGITFTFARLAAAGEGFVAYPGGERVEGFSNPTWTLLLTATQLIGLSPWVMSKLFGALFGALTLGLAWRWAHRLVPGPLALAAPLLLAVNPQFVIWNASGLENSIFNLFLAAGALRLLHELDDPEARPWSAVAWFGLAISRPEAPLYAGLALGLGTVWQALRSPVGALKWAVQWCVLFGLPFLAWHGWRYWYFAWEFPNTYYAKLGDGTEKFQPLNWSKKGWKYLRGYALDSTQGFLVPLYLLGQSGLEGWRVGAGVLLSVVTVLLMLPGLAVLELVDFVEPDALVALRVGWLALVVVLAPVVGLGRPGSAPRHLAWTLMIVAVFFALYSGGDWMDAYRWLAMPSVPMAVLLTDAVGVVAAAVRPLRPRFATPVAVLLLTSPVVASIVGTARFQADTDVSPFDVRERILYMTRVRDRLHLEHAVQLEVDFGAHMWWSGNELVDLGALMDVPMAHHDWDKDFMRMYVMEERVPHFAHIHGSWGRKSKLKRLRAWRDYIEIPGTPISKYSNHVGNWIRKDTFVHRRWKGPSGRRTAFGEDIELAGWRTQPQATPGQGLYVEVGWKRVKNIRTFRALLVLSGQDRLIVTELPPGYDWLPVKRWRRADVVHGRHTLPLPADLPTGSYDLAIVVLDGETGAVIPADTPAETPIYAAGERLWAGAVSIVDGEQAQTLARKAMDGAIASADGDRCVQATNQWTRARRLLDPDTHSLTADATDEVEGALARCFARRADFATARRWDHRDPDVLALGRAEADRLIAEAESSHDPYPLLRDALVADPTRSWVRRDAERLRAYGDVQ